MSTSIAIYVQALAPPHVGEWIHDVETRTADELAELIATATAHADEWRVSDVEGFGFEVPEHLSPEALLAIAEWCDAAGNDDELLRAACAIVATNDHGGVTADSLRAARRRFLGAFDEPGNYAASIYEHEAEQLGLLGRYVDFERLEHDLVDGGDLALVLVEERRFFFTP
ncbi:MAG: antirestriction protein ArdA [Sandaracinaceae bacterium]|nr:antirestriction protein ArdA [Sandaracinaceae bacterium]